MLPGVRTTLCESDGPDDLDDLSDCDWGTGVSLTSRPSGVSC